MATGSHIATRNGSGGRALLLAAALVASLVATPAVEAATHRFALIIGSNRGDATSEPLLHAERDAAKVHDVLTELGDVQADHIVLLDAPSADDVRTALDGFEAKFQALSGDPDENAVFILYYSGHGTSEYLELNGTHLPLDELRERLRGSLAGVRLAILDSCFSGAMIRAKGGHRAPSFPLAVDDHFKSEGYAFMTSSSEDERSQESDEVRGSFFTHFLTSGLRGGADFSGDGLVTLSEVYRYTYHQTLKQSALTGGTPQHPHFDYEISGEGEFVLTRLTRAEATVEFPVGTNGEYLLYAPTSGTVLGEVTVNTDERSMLVVPAGDYMLFERSGPVVLASSFSVGQGEVHVVDRGAMTPLSADEYRLKGPLVYVSEPRVFSLAPKFGYQSAFDASHRGQLFAPALLWGVEGVWERVGGLDGLSLVFDILASYGQQSMAFEGFDAGGRQDLLELNFGVAALWTWRFGDFAMSAGPRVAGIYLRRDVHDDVVDPKLANVSKGITDVFTGSILGATRFEWRPVDWFAASLEGRSGWMPIKLDGRTRHVGYGEVFLALQFYP